MPGLPQSNDSNQFSSSITTSLPCSNGSVSVNGFWSKQRGDISFNQLQKVLILPYLYQDFLGFLIVSVVMCFDYCSIVILLC